MPLEERSKAWGWFSLEKRCRQEGAYWLFKYLGEFHKTKLIYTVLLLQGPELGVIRKHQIQLRKNLPQILELIQTSRPKDLIRASWGRTGGVKWAGPHLKHSQFHPFHRLVFWVRFHVKNWVQKQVDRMNFLVPSNSIINRIKREWFVLWNSTLIITRNV